MDELFKPMPTTQLNNGLEMPVIGLGTSEGKSEAVQVAVETALNIGYRHIDAAPLDETETAIGKAISHKIGQGVVKREDLFVTAKLWNTFHEPSRVLSGLRKSLQNLQLNYLDSYLIHTPVGLKYVDDETRFPVDKNGKLLFSPFDHVEIWCEMEKAVDQGLTKTIGLSNFNQKQVQHILDHCRIKPAVLQIEGHAYLMQNELFELCRKHGIAVVVYAPFGLFSLENNEIQNKSPILREDTVVLDIAERFAVPPTQILLRYLIERGRFIVPTSIRKKHLRENLELFGFALSEDDLGRLDQLDRNQRYFNFESFRDSSEYPF